MNKLILVEGLPGSGKTTISKKIHNHLNQSIPTKLYQEGDGHPADLAWCACVPEDELDEVLAKFPDLVKKIKELMYIENGYAVVPYTQIKVKDFSFYDYMEKYEVYSNRVGFETFEKLHFDKWSKFGREMVNKNEKVVFECAYFQNHIVELMLYHCLKEEEITEYLLRLIKNVEGLNPVLIYLNQPDIADSIYTVSKVRINDKGEEVWLPKVIEYIEGSPYGKKNNLTGHEGMITFFEERKKIEFNIMKKLPIETHIVEISDYNWEDVWHQVRNILDGLR